MLTITLFRCNNSSTKDSSSPTIDNNPDNVATEISQLNSLIKKFEEPSQTFSIPSNKASTVKGKAGTKIKVNPVDLVAEDGKPLGKSIEVELKELTNSSQLLKSNAVTMSDGKLLVSGGAYYINMTSEGRQLRIKDNSSLDVEFPKLSDAEMSLFTGQRDSLGKMNWQATTQTFIQPIAKQQKPARAKADTSSFDDVVEIIDFLKDGSEITKDKKKEIEIHSKVFETMKLKSFGWINCDRFIDFPDKTNITIEMAPKDSIKSANLYLVFSDINSIMQADYYIGKKYSYNDGFRNVPVGRTVRIIAYSVKNDKILTYSADIKIKQNENLTLDFKPTSDADFEKLMSMK